MTTGRVTEVRVAVLVIDDDPQVRAVLTRLLARANYDCITAANATEARRALAGRPFALALCDVNLPDGSGLELVDTIGRDHPDTAVVMVTGSDDPAVAAVAAARGAYGYVIKPFGRNELLINASNALRRRDLEAENAHHRERLEELVAARTAELRRTVEQLEIAHDEITRSRSETLERLAWAAEYRDPETGSHLQRMSRYSRLLAELAGHDDEWCGLLELASPMHDVGKIAIPDEILLKPGRFDEGDRAVMAEHPLIGHRLLAGSSSALLDLAASIALTHHERYDGSGYPHGLRGEQIPVEGRIVAIADVFDALTTERRYKAAFSFDRAAATMRAEAGHFDPGLLERFLGARDEVEQIRDAHPDRLVVRSVTHP